MARNDRQGELFFEGCDYVHERDFPRLSPKLAHIFEIMSDGEWHTLPELHETTGYLTTTISAHIRELRKERWGGHTVHRKYLGNGLYAYKLEVRKD